MTLPFIAHNTCQMLVVFFSVHDQTGHSAKVRMQERKETEKIDSTKPEPKKSDRTVSLPTTNTHSTVR